VEIGAVNGEDILDRKSRGGREAVRFFLMVYKKVWCGGVGGGCRFGGILIFLKRIDLTSHIRIIKLQFLRGNDGEVS
jgi:hypothetical protein